MAHIEPPTMGHVVQESYIGNTHVMICDDFCREKTQDEINATLDRIAAIAVKAFSAKKEN